eukprot:919757-Amphidinium_carterae.1
MTACAAKCSWGQFWGVGLWRYSCPSVPLHSMDSGPGAKRSCCWTLRLHASDAAAVVDANAARACCFDSTACKATSQRYSANKN